jgi:hypothetical protein
MECHASVKASRRDDVSRLRDWQNQKHPVSLGQSNPPNSPGTYIRALLSGDSDVPYPPREDPENEFSWTELTIVPQEDWDQLFEIALISTGYSPLD